MVNSHRLRRLAQAVLDDRRLREEEEKEKKERREREAEDALAAQQIREWPSLIEDEVEKAASSGKFSYEHDCGPSCDERVIKHLLSYFVDLEPSAGRVKKSRIVRYDPPVDEDYWTTVITFRW